MKLQLQLVILCCIFGLVISKKRKSHEDKLPDRIVGGTEAEDGLAPYQCSIQVNGRHMCGCAIISKKWVITAAHCFQIKNRELQKITVLVGTNHLKDGGKHYKTERLIGHKKFNQPPFAFDIGLILIDGEIAFNEKVQPIEYSSKFVEGGSKLRVTGWGWLHPVGRPPQHLQVLDVNAISNDECKKRLKPYHESQLCTFNKIGQGVCAGDSGGPLVLDDELVGIVSFSAICGFGFPDGFARISYFYDWIKSHVEAEIPKLLYNFENSHF